MSFKPWKNFERKKSSWNGKKEKESLLLCPAWFVHSYSRQTINRIWSILFIHSYYETQLTLRLFVFLKTSFSHFVNFYFCLFILFSKFNSHFITSKINSWLYLTLYTPLFVVLLEIIPLISAPNLLRQFPS